MIYFRKGFIKNNTFSLHFRSLKKFLKGRVMAPELAYALFTALFFKWNQKLKAAKYRYELVSNEIFGVGGSSMQAIESSLDNFLGKWCSKNLVAVNHPILTQLKTLHSSFLISSFIKIANIEEIISQRKGVVFQRCSSCIWKGW